MKIPESTRNTLQYRLSTRARERWPELLAVPLHFRDHFAYVDGELEHAEKIPLCRLRYGGSARSWGFAVSLANGYEDSVLPTGLHAGSPEDALDCACGLHLADPAAWRVDPQ
ncbi:MAG: hypothetical protein ACRDZ8_20910 [Acidimicrobiales bacterium]